MFNQTLFKRLSILALFFFLSGCAGKPWTNTLDENQSDSVKIILQQMQDRDARCSCCLETDITVSWDTPIGKKSIGGYLYLMTPCFFKYITTNPLGQPVYAIVTNGHDFQSINTSKRKYLSGSLNSLLLSYDVPTTMLFYNWGAYLTGRLQSKNWQFEEFRHDRENRGIWVTIRLIDGNSKRKNHLLIDTTTKKLLSRIIVDETEEDETEEDTIAIINYDEWVAWENGWLPTKITLSKFAFNSIITILLSNISKGSKKDINTFKITPPPGYFQQIFP